MREKINSISLVIILIILTGLFTNKLYNRNKIIEMQYMKIDNLEYEIEDLVKHITMLEREITRTSEVKITFYAPKLKGINSDSDHTKTATMQEPIPGWTCAISRDLVDAGWLGRKIWIKGLGIRYASDIMADSYNGNPIRKQIDICVGKKYVKSEAKKLGNNINILATAL
jgi:hypothetical protein